LVSAIWEHADRVSSILSGRGVDFRDRFIHWAAYTHVDQPTLWQLIIDGGLDYHTSNGESGRFSTEAALASNSIVEFLQINLRKPNWKQ